MNKLLFPAEMAKDNMEAESLEAIADKGYESSKDIEACLINGIVSNVGFIQDREQRVFVVEIKTKEIPEQKRCSTKSEDIQECLRASVLPKRYEDTSISLEVKHQNAISCFIRHEDGHVIRPWARSYAFKYSDDGSTIRLDTKKSKAAFIKLLNDAFLRSELTKEYYEARAKDNITNS